MRKVIPIVAIVSLVTHLYSEDPSDWFKDYLTVGFEYKITVQENIAVRKFPEVEFVSIKPAPHYLRCGGVLEGVWFYNSIIEDIEIYHPKIVYPVRELLRKTNWWPVSIKSEPVAGGDATR